MRLKKPNYKLNIILVLLAVVIYLSVTGIAFLVALVFHSEKCMGVLSVDDAQPFVRLAKDCYAEWFWTEFENDSTCIASDGLREKYSFIFKNGKGQHGINYSRYLSSTSKIADKGNISAQFYIGNYEQYLPEKRLKYYVAASEGGHKLAPSGAAKIYETRGDTLNALKYYNMALQYDSSSMKLKKRISALEKGKYNKNWVDLNLPSGNLWCAYNIGSYEGNINGDYVEWQELMSFQKEGHIIPSYEDYAELFSNCKMSFDRNDNVNGIKLTGKNGEFIFLSAGGYYENKIERKNKGGFYWTSTKYSPKEAYGLSFDYECFNLIPSPKDRGRLVRTIKSSSIGISEGYRWVDLALPSGTKWATTNVGASRSFETGQKFSWGESSEKELYNSKTSLTTGQTISNINGNRELNAAINVCGPSWEIPTKAQWQELIDNCTWSWTELDGQTGYKVQGKNGKSIFLPAAGYKNGTINERQGKDGGYWSSDGITDSKNNMCYYLLIDDNFKGVNHSYRFYGRSIRPVLKN